MMTTSVANQTQYEERQLDIFSVSGLKRLHKEDLLYRLEMVDAQSALIRWRILAELRGRYGNTFQESQYFFNYIESMRDKYNIKTSQANISREILAGKFCEQYKIDNLQSAGLSKFAIYELSRPSNKDFAGKILKEILKKNVPITEVARRINEHRTVLVIEQGALPFASQSTKEELLNKGKSFIPVINNTAMEPGINTDLIEELARPENVFDITINKPYANHDNGIADTQDFIDITRLSSQQIVDIVSSKLNCVPRIKLLEELARQNMSHCTDEDIIAEIMLLCESYRRSVQLLIRAVQQMIKSFSNSRYGKMV